MGMAASQARYLALVARKSNCEYEGQQINQARLALSNQSANLFNQMLGLKVPVPPSTTDFTKEQYSFKSGNVAVTLDKWNQLAEKDENYNYVITYHYNSDVYTGSQKQMTDPQVQFAHPNIDISPDYERSVEQIQEALKSLEAAQEAYDTAKSELQSLQSAAKKMSTYVDKSTFSGVISATSTGDTYNVTYTKKDIKNNVRYDLYKGNLRSDESNPYYYRAGKFYGTAGDDSTLITPLTAQKDDQGNIKTETIDGITYQLYKDSSGVQYYFDYASADKQYYTSVTSTAQRTLATNVDVMEAIEATETFHKYTTSDTDITDAIEILYKNGAIDSKDTSQLYVTADGKSFAYVTDLESAKDGKSTIVPVYNYNATPTEGDTWTAIKTIDTQIEDAQNNLTTTKRMLDLAQQTYDSLNVPEYIGNCKLTPLSELDSSQQAEIAQVIKDMQKDGIKTTLTNHYNVESGEYTGGIYTFVYNGINYYATYEDLADCAVSGEGINHIDNQQSLPFYRADYISTKIEKTEKALLETDSSGRFTSIRLEDDTVKYTLSVETITDEAAYEDAMNQYYYENAKYDKMIQDINAKTSVIQAEDRTLELRLKQLDTEQNALSTEIDAVSKVVKDNVEKSFKTFGG